MVTQTHIGYLLYSKDVKPAAHVSDSVRKQFLYIADNLFNHQFNAFYQLFSVNLSLDPNAELMKSLYKNKCPMTSKLKLMNIKTYQYTDGPLIST